MPPNVEYSLTEQVKKLSTIIDSLRIWGKVHYF
ncbi:winged helix-turn-helix transcriptional regulator [Paenibacillus lautus]